MDTKVKRIEGKLKEVIMNPNIPGMNPQPAQPMPNTQPVQPQPTTNAQSQGYTQNQYAQPAYQQVAQPTYPQNQPVYQQPTQTVSQPVQMQAQVDPMAAVTNLNKEEAMEEALSHTTQYSPFQAQVAEIKPEVEQANNKKAIIMIGIIVAIIALFIVFLPQISSLFGWRM